MSTVSEIEEPDQRSGIISTGLALFSMFFGAGNLVFPLLVGQEAGSHTPWALMGLSLSAVGFPLLGLVAMMFYGGNLRLFLARLGKMPAFILLFILQVSMGPLGCMPRLITLMHASLKPYFPELTLLVFSILAAAIIFALTVRPQKVVDLLGVILTPLLLLTLAILIVVGLIDAPAIQPSVAGASHHFMEGVKGGYQTMDLLGSLLFATVVMPHLARGLSRLSPDQSKKLLRNRIIGASAIATVLLMATYMGLCWISAHHGWTLPAGLLPEEKLHAIAVKILGPFGGAIASTAVILACLTTAISLATVFSDYLRVDVFQKKTGSVLPLALTLGGTAAVANLGFTGIVRFMGPLLEILYPGIIVLCLLNIAHHYYQVKPLRVPVFIALAVAAISFCIS